MTDLLEDADVLIVIGSSLGEVTSNYFTFAPRGRIIQIDAEPRVLESNSPGLGIRADAGQALAALDEALAAPVDTTRSWHGTTPEDLVKDALAKVRERLESQDLGKELKFMSDIREAVPADMQTFWDMTISAYWAGAAGMHGRASSTRPRVPAASAMASRRRSAAPSGWKRSASPAGSSPCPVTVHPCTPFPNSPPPSSTTSRSPG
ncbi:hypothetical protein AHiyo4_09740 [Arthrobacter sp. Hiyo4]|nr:hypothetical protein AHiyo4_09740 [Arthrobacter sp. Hiyo4]